MQRKLIVSIIISVGILVLGWLIFSALSSMGGINSQPRLFDKTKYVKTQKSSYGTHLPRINAYGRLKAMNKLEIFSEVTGMMKSAEKPFKVGTYFAKGETIIEIEAAELRSTLNARKADFLNQLTMMLPDMKIDYPESFPKWNEYISNFDFYNDLPEIPQPKDNKEKLFLANRGIYSSYYNIRSQEIHLAKYQITAPFAGVITQSLIEPGSLVRMNQKIGELSATGSFELELSIPLQEAEYVSTGSQVKVTAETTGKEYSGRIVRLAKSLDKNTQTIIAFVAVAGNDLKEGMYMRGSIAGDKIDNAVKVPRKALVNNTYVYFINDSLLDRARVNIDFVSEEYAYINGIDSNLTLIVEPLVNANLGMKVVPIDNAKQGTIR